MAILEGARYPGILAPRRERPAREAKGEGASTRRRVSSPARARRRAEPARRGIAVIAVLFLVGFLYLDQAVHVSATNYDLARLSSEREQLLRQIASLEGELLRQASEPVVVERAQAVGLTRLGDPVRLIER
jgi:hypothetical protein